MMVYIDVSHNLISGQQGVFSISEMFPEGDFQ
jgi:hypothetical protein